VKSFDTNVVVRILVKDDPEQYQRAEAAWRKAVAEDGVFLSTTVLVEVVWVLRAACKLDRANIIGALRRLIDSEGVTVDEEAIVRRAVDSFEAGAADFSDYIIRETAREANALPVLTFDQQFAREPDVQMVAPK
jgi:predicted nucleic-acid-binding protein